MAVSLRGQANGKSAAIEADFPAADSGSHYRKTRSAPLLCGKPSFPSIRRDFRFHSPLPWAMARHSIGTRRRLGTAALLAVLHWWIPLERLAAETGPQASEDIPTLSYTLVKTWPHDRGAFTEGLVFWEGLLIESTGLNGHSTLRKVDLETGLVRQEIKLPEQYFGEGIAVLDGKIFQLTWQSHRGFIYDLKSMKPEGEFSFTGEGWGLTTDGRSLIMTDGTNRIRFLDPATFQVTRTIDVFAHGQPVEKLNELEYVKGELYANVWQTEFVLRIDPANGRILDAIDFVGILPPADHAGDTDVMNGIAYDARDDRLFVTGKNWPKLFEVKVKPN
jgi:glutamine cyclotransferase